MTLRHLPEIQLVKNHELTHNGNQLVKKQTSEPVMLLSIEMGVKLGDDWMWAIDFQTGFRHNDVAPRLRPQQNILECRAECHYAEYRGAIESSSVFKTILSIFCPRQAGDSIYTNMRSIFTFQSVSYLQIVCNL